MDINLNVTPVFHKNFIALNNNDIRFIVNVGGTRSSKTYSLCQMILIYCVQHNNKVVSIVRKSFPALRSSVMRDMIDILKENELYDERNHNKTENIYKFKNGSIIEFFSIDDEQKIRGRKRDVLWANEANELNFEEFNQLNMRTTTKLIFDFNPSDLYHWLYDLMLKDESIKIHSTYKDNPFLEEAIVKQIEDLKNVDEEYYKIYTLGEQALAKSTIYSHQKEFTDYPEDISDFVYGLDFGYNHPTALIKVSKNDNSIYGEEIIYQSHLTTSDLINLMNQLEIDKNKYILCDTARPEIIQELRRSGYNVINANKNVKEGIDAVKSSILYLKNDSLNLWKEIRTYKWKTQGEKILDEPVKINDDAMDALRYGILYLKKSISKGINSSFVSFSI